MIFKNNNFLIFSFKICMKACLLQISGYKQLYLDVESVRKRPYDSENLQHEKLLLKVNFCFLYLELVDTGKINQTWASKVSVPILEALLQSSSFFAPYYVGERFWVNYFYDFLISLIEIYTRRFSLNAFTSKINYKLINRDLFNWWVCKLQRFPYFLYKLLVYVRLFFFFFQLTFKL